MASVDMCEHDWPGTGCEECRREAMVAAPEVTKETNPKDAVGIRKAPLSTIPAQVLGEVGLAMLEGARKYGRSNYRVAGVRASVYYDAAMRHLIDWWEGVDVDPDSGLSHVTKAIAALCVLRDAQMNRMCEDDRPPSVADPDWMAAMSRKAGEIIDRYPNPKAPFVREAEKPTVVLYVKPHEGAA